MNAPEFIIITSASEVCGILNIGNACTAKSKDGNTVITIQRKTGGLLQCTAMRYGRIREQHEFKKMVQVVKWAYRWLKEIKEIDNGK